MGNPPYYESGSEYGLAAINSIVFHSAPEVVAGSPVAVSYRRWVRQGTIE